MKADATKEKKKQAVKEAKVPMGVAREERDHRVVLGDSGVHADQRNAGAGARDSVGLDGEHLADRRSPDHEPNRLRRRNPVHELARAAVAQSEPPADHHFQAAVRSHLCQIM